MAIKDAIDKKRISRDELLDIIAEDNNILRAAVITELNDGGYLNYLDLCDKGVEDEFISYHIDGRKNPVNFSSPDRLQAISNEKCYEVYFWGLPSSGKTCALGAIMSVANNGRVARSMKKDNNCQGYGYMNMLSNIFRRNRSVGSLPEGTAILDTYEMGFVLEDNKKKNHTFTFVDLAGEIIRCMYKRDANEPLSSDQEQALNTVEKLLIGNRTTNRKIHFFVIEYGGESREYEGLDQHTYLDGTLRYIERTGIFKKETDAIYILFTKVDKITKSNQSQLSEEEITEELKRYTDDYYLGFYNGLKSICEKFEINKGRVERIAFSLGKVCFQDYCMFDDRWAANVIEILLDRTVGDSTGWPGKFGNIFRG